jgi:hypothetical protein
LILAIILALIYGFLIIVQEWCEADVSDWLRTIGLEDYVESFNSNHISGNNLFDLTESELKEDLKMVSVGHRVIFEKSVENLKKLMSKTREETLKSRFLSLLEKDKLKKDFRLVPGGSLYQSDYQSRGLSDVAEEDKVVEDENANKVFNVKKK